MRFKVNPHSIVAWMSRELFARNRCKIWSLSDCNSIRTHNQLGSSLSSNTTTWVRVPLQLLKCYTYLHNAGLAFLLSYKIKCSQSNFSISIFSQNKTSHRYIQYRDLLSLRFCIILRLYIPLTKWKSKKICCFKIISKAKFAMLTS